MEVLWCVTINVQTCLSKLGKGCYTELRRKVKCSFDKSRQTNKNAFIQAVCFLKNNNQTADSLCSGLYDAHTGEAATGHHESHSMTLISITAVTVLLRRDTLST